MTKTLRQRATSTGTGMIIGLAVSMLITITMLAVMAKLIQNEIIKENSVGYGIMAALLLSSFAGAVTGAILIQRRKGLICLIAGILYWGTLIALTALFFGGQYQSVGVTGLLILAGSGSAVLMTAKERRGKRRKIR